MGSVVIAKIRESFPNLDLVAWAIVCLTFLLIVLVAIPTSNRLMKIPRLSISEGYAETISIILVAIVVALLFYATWPLTSGFLTIHFGQFQ